MSTLSLALFAAALPLGCTAPSDTGEPLVNGPMPEVAPPEPTLRRLTATQYENVVVDLFGPGLVLPRSLEPDVEAEGLLQVGNASSSVSALGIERYEDAALLLAEQVTEDPERFDALMPCTPQSSDDAACAAELVERLGARAWRRPLTEDEIVRYAAVISEIGAQSGSFETGALYGIAALLQSPHFLYRTEHGTSGGDGTRTLTDHELAARMSFLLWNGLPDDELLELAAQGQLQDDAVRVAQAQRMLDDPRASLGVRNLFDEVLELYELEHASKDPLVYTHASNDLYAAAHEETMLLLEDIVLARDADIREILTADYTYIDRRLAALYEIPAAQPDGFGLVVLDREDQRRGLLGHASTLLLHSYATRSSATLRGAFVRETLLCQTVSPPPANVDTSIPEPDEDSPTMRERIAVHLEDPTCAGCHLYLDPIGLGLENFDGVGRWRRTENGGVIDPSGDVDGIEFTDAWDMGGAIAEHPEYVPCMTTHLYQYALGHRIVAADEGDYVDWLAVELQVNGYSLQSAILALVGSPAFTTVEDWQ